jgi:hypothetical protein
MPLCSGLISLRDDGRVALAEMALSHQRGANGATSNGRHELLSPLTAHRAPEQDRAIGKAAIPTVRFMGEKSGFAKAEALENEWETVGGPVCGERAEPQSIGSMPAAAIVQVG